MQLGEGGYPWLRGAVGPHVRADHGRERRPGLTLSGGSRAWLSDRVVSVPPPPPGTWCGVRAVVMTRDDSSGGWLPVGGGGLSQVSVCRVRGARPEGGARQGHYVVHGERLRDQKTTLECALRPGLVYNKVNPIFHHWSLGDCKFGLTFQSPAEADEFQKSLLAALGQGSLTPSSSSSSSSSPSQDTAETPCPLTSYPPLLPFTGIPESSEPLAGPGGRGWGGRGYEDYRRAGPPPPLALSTCVVRFAKTGTLRGAALGSPTALPAAFTEPAPPAPPARPPPGPGPAPAPAKASPEAEEAARCVHCRALFRRRADGRGGRCAEAPDPGRLLVRRLSCLWCAESLLYHCLSDAEGDFSDPCACEPGHPRPAARWAALAALSLAVPCLCCYAPLRACHWVAARCGCAGCGGRHEEAAR
ncbi:sprouty-related, EVH1 domain-containing protein 3 isoform X2 [Loxodonta africana]|uniref:sprouty-related, EVH1 domain-containing protein 3 isoform X2 n=1 Tax=Loxodonta africana TaxID=9785 RepID=UPI0030CE2157